MAEQRPKFDTLFADPRHYRGDCRLMRTAIRRGWLDNAPQADRDALIARFHEAMNARREADPDGREVRALLAECRAAIGFVDDDQTQALRMLRYVWAGGLTARMTGRPRDRWHVSDYANRIDANELRRRAKSDGSDLRTLTAIIVRRSPDKQENNREQDDAGERVELSVVADARYGCRVWLVCPRCRKRRMHLYPVRAGVRCRKCAGIVYADRQQ